MKQLNEINKTIKKDIIVENLVISNGVYLLVSHPKVGKSMFAQQLAFSLTTGEDFLGFKVNPSHVLYITTEGDINQLETRFKLMNLKPKLDKLHIIDSDDISDFYIRDIEYNIHQLASNNQKLFVIIDMLKDMIKMYRLVGINITLNGDLFDDENVSKVLFEIIRESVTNAIIHADSKNIYIDLDKKDKKTIIEITNDGKMPAKRITENEGIKGMRRKLNSIGGMLTIDCSDKFVLKIII